MPNYKLLIEYDGTDFHGWQFQPNLRTVQGELEKAATTFFREDIRLHPAGRTDSGVHARGMVANFKTDKQVSTERLKKALNGISGKDVVIHEVSIVNEEFNSRWSATGREYLYRISRVCSAIDRNFIYYVRDALDASKMNEAVHCLKGSHNFKAFSLAIPKEKHYLCRVDFAEWLENGDEIYFRIKANRFLHGMVRILVGSSILVGKGMMTVEKFEQILQSQDSREAGYKAPPQGLCLMKVYYDND